MNSSPRARRRRRTANHWVLAPALALLIGSGSLPAFADAGPADPGSIAAPIAGTPVQAAQLQAASTGQSVPIPSLTTETTTVSANPDGSLTQTQNLMPVRVQKNGAWTGLDATLSANSDGTYSPAATPSGITLSGGGTSPMATMTDPDGRTLSFTLPFSLPAPTVTGSTAFYPAVLPGVDLSVTVTDQGGFSDVLVVHNAAAAANPALQNLTFTTATQGLTLSTGTQGLTATAPDQSVSFLAPPASEWDSSTTPATTTASASATTSPAEGTNALHSETVTRGVAVTAADSTATPSPTASPSTDPSDSGTPTASSTAGPGTEAQVAPVALNAGDGTLTLTPDPSLLTSATTTWPLYIDPGLAPAGASNYFEAQEGCDSASSSGQEYDYAQKDGEGVGYQAYDSSNGDCIGVERTFYDMDTSSLKSDMDVTNATFDLTETYAAAHSCVNAVPLTLYKTDPISSGMYWDTQPGRDGASVGSASYTSAYNGADPSDTTSCGKHLKHIDVTPQMQDTAKYQYPTWTVGLVGDESNSDNFMRFNINPTLTITYDLAPTVADATTDPPAQTVNSAGVLTDVGSACGTGTPGWIGMTSAANNGSQITMEATASSPVEGNHVATWFDMFDEQTSDGTGKPATATYGNTIYAASPNTAGLQMTSLVKDGHQYNWSTQASDGTMSSNTISDCRFNVDLTPPTQATVTDTDFPAAGSGGTPDKYAGQSSTFTFASTDPAPDPSTCTLGTCVPASGVAGFRYSLDQPIPTTGFSYVAADSTGKGSIPITPETWGTHILYVQAIDNAGNTAAVPSSYTFYAPWNPDTNVHAGDLNGDGVPDLLATSGGNLILLPGNTDPGSPSASQIASTPTTSPDGTLTSPDSWNNFLVAHRGSLTQEGVDDLFAYNKNTHEMYSYGNDKEADLTPGHFTYKQDVDTLTRPACTGTCIGYYTNPTNRDDWGTITQMVAAGSISAAPGSVATPAEGIQPTLITMENGQLWLYTFTGGVLNTPILLGTGNWSNFDLIAPGPVGGNLNATPETAGTPTLWVRDRATGTLYTMPITNSQGTVQSLAPPTLALTLPLKATDGNHLCADDTYGGTTAGNPIQTWDCNQTGPQSWTMHTNGTVAVLGNCLDLAATAPVSGTTVVLNPCTTTGTQQWTATTTGQLKTGGGLCLTDPGSSTTDGAQLTVATCDNGPEQDWTGATSANQPFGPLTDPTSFGPNLPVAAYPSLASPGDKTGLGEPDLYVATPDGEMIDYSGSAPTSTGTATFAPPVLQGTYSIATAWWELNDGGTSTTATDSIGGPTGSNTATLNGNATWTTDTVLTEGTKTVTGHPALLPANPTSTVLSLDGTTGYAATTAPVINTSGSYTVSLWVNLNQNYNTNDYYTALCQRDTSGARCGFYLQYSPAYKGWALVMPGTDAANTPTYFHAGTGITPTGFWTHLVGVYDATTGAMNLYVNGSLAGTGTDTTPWATAAGGPLLIGGADGGNTPGTIGDFPGEISDVHVYNTALSPAAATSIGDTPPPITGLN